MYTTALYICSRENPLQDNKNGFSSNLYGQVFMYQLMIEGNLPRQKSLAAE